jgi:hypothetical protein
MSYLEHIWRDSTQIMAPPPYDKKGSGNSICGVEVLLLLWSFGAAPVPEMEHLNQVYQK